MAQEQHTWGREHRRDGNSEWPSTGFSTISGEPREGRPVRQRHRYKRTSYLSLVLPFLLVLAAGGVGVLLLARHLQG